MVSFTLDEDHACICQFGATERELGECVHPCQAGYAGIADETVVHQVQRGQGKPWGDTETLEIRDNNIIVRDACVVQLHVLHW